MNLILITSVCPVRMLHFEKLEVKLGLLSLLLLQGQAFAAARPGV